MSSKACSAPPTAWRRRLPRSHPLSVWWWWWGEGKVLPCVALVVRCLQPPVADGLAGRRSFLFDIHSTPPTHTPTHPQTHTDRQTHFPSCALFKHDKRSSHFENSTTLLSASDEEKKRNWYMCTEECVCVWGGADKVIASAIESACEYTRQVCALNRTKAGSGCVVNDATTSLLGARLLVIVQPRPRRRRGSLPPIPPLGCSLMCWIACPLSQLHRIFSSFTFSSLSRALCVGASHAERHAPHGRLHDSSPASSHDDRISLQEGEKKVLLPLARSAHAVK